MTMSKKSLDDLLLEALAILKEQRQENFARELAAMMRRMFPHKREEVGKIMTPSRARAALPAKEVAALAEDNEARTFVYPGAESVPVPEKKRAAAARPARSVKPAPEPEQVEQADEADEWPWQLDGESDPVESEAILIEAADGPKRVDPAKLLSMDSDTLVAEFGTLKALKEHLVKVMEVKLPKSASKDKAAEAFKEQIRELYG